MTINATKNPVLTCGNCMEYERVDRRSFLTSGFRSAAALLLGERLIATPAWMPRISVAAPDVGPRGDTLVCIFLRGGADGLNMVVPHGDESYYQARPTLGIARPDDNGADFRAVDLDGFFGLHPALGALSEIFVGGDLALVHATGSPDETRSHFEAMALMERGATSNGDFAGWLARHLATLDTDNDSALRAVGIGEMLPASLTGAVSATALQGIDAYHLNGRDSSAAELQTVLTTLYSQDEGLLNAVAERTFEVIDLLRGVRVSDYQPAGRTYPETEFGMAMGTVAQLIKADVGVEVACIDLGGWDTHAGQGAGQGQMARNMQELADGLAAFHGDLQTAMESVTVVVMSEFGRRVKENAALGTDHGHGSLMMVMGGGIQGGRVYADWPGLHVEARVGPGDLAVTTDYRDVLGEIIERRLNNARLSEIFPGYTVNEVGLAVPRS